MLRGQVLAVSSRRVCGSYSVSLVRIAPQASSYSFTSYKEKVMGFLWMLLESGLDAVAMFAGFIDTITC